MLADDVRSLCADIESTLEDAGYAVREAETGALATSLCVSESLMIDDRKGLVVRRAPSSSTQRRCARRPRDAPRVRSRRMPGSSKRLLLAMG